QSAGRGFSVPVAATAESDSSGRRTLGPLVRGNQPVSPPSGARKPAPRGRDGRWTDPIRRTQRAPAGEPWSRRARIDSCHGFQMLPEIHQNVHEGMVHRPRCGEGSGVVPAVPYLSAAAELAVHGPGEADGEPADSTGTRAPVLGLHDQMEVIVLDRKFDDPELGARGRGKGAAHGGEEPAGAKAADLIH